MPRPRRPSPRPKRRKTRPARLRSRSQSPASRTPSPRGRTPSPPRRTPTQAQHAPPPQQPAASTAMTAVADSINAMQAAFLQQQQVFLTAMHTLQTTLGGATPAQQTLTPPSATYIPPRHPTSDDRVDVCHTPSSYTDDRNSTPAVQNMSTAPAVTPTTDTFGEHLPIVFRPTSRPLRITAAPLGHNIPHPIKVKIWEHKFIELSDLISTHRSTDYTLDLTTEDGQPQFRLASKKKKPLSQNEWCQAMDTFIAIYVEKFPDEIRAILSYAQTVKDLMHNKANWVWYDSQFRTDREFTHCKWDEVRQDLELRAFRQPSSSFERQEKPFRSYNANKNRRNSEDHVPTGFCYAYHSKSQRCHNTKCSYKHTCPRCNRQHPNFMQCNTQQPGSHRPSFNNRRYDNDRRDKPKNQDTRQPKSSK